MTRRETLALLAIGAGSGRSSSAVDAVNVSVLVRSSSGELVRALGIDDFTLDASGRPQTIRYFSRATETPLTVGLLIDPSVRQIRRLEGERRASDAFLERMRTESQATRVHVVPLGGGKLYDAIVLVCNEHMRWQPGRKACLLLSDGIDDESESSLAEAIRGAQRADTLIYSILISDWSVHNSRQEEGVKALQRISQETGARYFVSLQRMGTIFAEIEEELRSIYSLGFTPEAADSGYRAIHVGVKRSALVVRARDGYYSPLPGAGGLRIVGVEPRFARTGGLVTLSGNGLDRSNIASLFLTDAARTVAAEMVEQSTTEIRFKVPAQTEAGPWREGEERPHRWSIMLQTTGGELLQYIGFKIGIE
jgi:Ca-activated chloride channel family protein